jgi:glycosyltransferase involved in cell wall biosynthesis
MPKVSVLCNTYNHEAYIAQCLDSFLAQETSFEVEYLVHDDASTDRTPQILRDYDQRYPGKFKLWLQTENQFSKGIGIIDLNMSRATGDYIAVCDGDDYWCDPHKLQRQADYLDAHPECSLAVHAHRILLANDPTQTTEHKFSPIERDFTLREMLETPPTPFAYSTFMFRRKDADYGPAFRTLGYTDLPRLIYSASIGTVHYTPLIQSVYRRGVANSYVYRNVAVTGGALHHVRKRIAFYTAIRAVLPTQHDIIDTILQELTLYEAAKSKALVRLFKTAKAIGFTKIPLKRWIVLLGDLLLPGLMSVYRQHKRQRTLA